MEYQKIINLLDNAPNQATKFRTKNWVELNNELRGTYNTNKLDLKLQCYGQAYVITVIHIYFLKEI